MANDTLEWLILLFVSWFQFLLHYLNLFCRPVNGKTVKLTLWDTAGNIERGNGYRVDD